MISMNKKIVITLERQFGSGGLEIGKKVADKLGIPCYNKEILQQAAEKALGQGGVAAVEVEHLTPQGAGGVHIVHALQLEQRHLPLRADGGDVIALAALCRRIETACLFEEIHAVAPQLQLHFAAHTVGGDDLACFQILLHILAPVQPLSLASLDSSPTEGSLWRRGKVFRYAKASPR